MATRRQFSGVAVETTTVALLTIGGGTVDITNNTGWPSTPAVPFAVAIDFDSVALVEKCLATIVGSTLTLTRAQDGTTAKQHAAGAKILHVLTAVDADEANELAALATTFGRSLIDDANAATARTTLVLGSVDDTSDANKPVSTATQTALDLKANLASPTFTGTVAGITKTMVGLGSVDNTTDAGKPVSTAQQTALDLKAPIASPTFTGTVGGVTKAMVGLGSADNTTDANKPVSTATQTALDLKAATATTVSTTAPLAGGGDLSANRTLSIVAATTLVPGSMSAADKTKLDGVATGANNYVHPNHSGDVTSVADGAQTIAADAVTNAKAANMVTKTYKGRTSAGTGDPEDVAVATVKTDLDLSGTNTGDQTSIVGITGTVAQFNTAITDGDLATGGGTATGTNTGDQTLPVGGTPAVVLGTANTAGASTNFLRRDDTILAFDVTVPSTQAFGDAATVGVAATVARRDHKHAMPANPSDASITVTDVTTNDVSTSAHGFAPKVTNTANYLKGDGTWAAPTASVAITEVEIDVGSTPVCEASIAVTDAGVSASSKILGGVAYKAPTGKDLDELEMDALELKFEPGAGTFNVHIKGLEGYIADKFRVWYTAA